MPRDVGGAGSGPARSGPLRVGLDIGGTFTDLFVFDESDGSLRTGKSWSRPGDPIAVVETLDEVQISPPDIAVFSHAATTGINAVVTRTGAPTGLLTTRGHRDVLDMGRGLRPLDDLWDLDRTRPHLARPLVPRHWRRPITERVLSDGSVLVPLEEDEVLREAAWLVDQGVRSLAIFYLNSYANPEHERRTRDLVRERFPDLEVFASTDIFPVFNEVFRTTSVTINAYVSPAVDAYVDRLRGELGSRGFAGLLTVMKADGGFATADAARGRGIETIHSGPVAGVSAAHFIGEAIGRRDLLLIDMGGTTADVSVITDGTIPVTREYEVELDLFLGLPSVDVRSIGAGGGSVAWVDTGGALRVGPESAGAYPGPACYGHGGDRPTVTDAHVARGTMYPPLFLGGRAELDVAAAIKAVSSVGEALGMPAEMAAQGIVDIVDTNMAAALRDISVYRGLHPRDYTLIAFGAAGPMHASALGRELGVAEVVVPPWPGELSAFGLLVADYRVERGRSLFRLLATVSADELNGIFEDLERDALAALRDQDVDPSNVRVERWMDGLYLGQGSETRCVLPAGPYDPQAAARLSGLFEEAYERRWGSRLGMPVQVTSVGLTAIGYHERPNLPRVRNGSTRPVGAALLDTIEATLREDGKLRRVACSVYDRAALRVRNRVRGPALIVQPTSTTILLPGDSAEIDDLGNIRIHAKG